MYKLSVIMNSDDDLFCDRYSFVDNFFVQNNCWSFSLVFEANTLAPGKYFTQQICFVTDETDLLPHQSS